MSVSAHTTVKKSKARGFCYRIIPKFAKIDAWWLEVFNEVVVRIEVILFNRSKRVGLRLGSLYYYVPYTMN
jgi:hypothetical protein